MLADLTSYSADCPRCTEGSGRPYRTAPHESPRTARVLLQCDRCRHRWSILVPSRSSVDDVAGGAEPRDGVDATEQAKISREAKADVRLSLRFIVPLLLVLAAFAYAVLPLVDGLTVRWFMRDLDIRASLIANTVREPIENSIRYGDEARVLQALTRITEDERVYAVAFCPSPDARTAVGRHAAGGGDLCRP